MNVWACYKTVIREIYVDKNKESKIDTSFLDGCINEKTSEIEKNNHNDITELINNLKIIMMHKVYNWILWTHDDISWKSTKFYNKITKEKMKKNHYEKSASKHKWNKIIDDKKTQSK